MSIKLDWEVESEGGWSEIGEDAAALAARKRQAERARRILIVLLVVALVVGGAVGFRLYTADQQARADLRATVAAETAAIRIGDSSAYLDIQQNVGSWQKMQAKRFGQYQADSGRVKADGEVVTLDIDGGKGRVVVREMVDDDPYNVVWFYQHADDGWRHVPPEIAFWGWPRETISAHYKISYWDEDAAFTTTIQDKLELWWDAACTLTGCRQMGGIFPDLLKIRIEPDPLLQIGWAAYDEETLRVPSPLLGRVPADGSLDPDLERALAGYVAEHWSRKLLGAPPDDYGDVAWAHDEFRLWLVSEFIPGEPPAPILGPLAESSGPYTAMALLGRVRQNDDVVNAIKTITGKEATDLPLAWDRYLTYRLRSESVLLDGNHTTEAILLYRDPERSSGDSVLDAWIGLYNATPDSITVTSTHRVGDLLWAETHFIRVDTTEYLTSDGMVRTHRIEPAMTYEPFRMVNGRWVHTLPLDTDYGESVEEQSQHIILRYRAIDTLTVDGLLTDLEQQYMTLVTDLGIEDTPPVVVDMSPGVFGGGSVLLPLTSNPAGSGDGIRMSIGSPYSTIFPAGQPLRDTLRAELTRSLAFQLAGYRAYPMELTNPLVVALAQWELNRLGLATSNLIGDPVTQFAEPPETLDALWAESQTATTRGEKYIAASVLVDLVVEKAGSQAIPLLLENLPGSTSMEDWLSRSVGLHALDIEPGWKLRVRAALPQAQP